MHPTHVRALERTHVGPNAGMHTNNAHTYVEAHTRTAKCKYVHRTHIRTHPPHIRTSKCTYVGINAHTWMEAVMRSYGAYQMTLYVIGTSDFVSVHVSCKPGPN